MKKSLMILTIVLVLATLLSACGPKAAAVGEALVTVSGKISEKNSGDTYVLDQAAFDAKSVELTYNDPWMGDGLKYKGILLKDLITLVGGSGATTISLVATDGKGFDVAVADAQQWDIMLARWVDGTLLTTDNGGPVKVAYPDASKGNYPDEQWAWWVVRVEFK